jgi:hypothetical protein
MAKEIRRTAPNLIAFHLGWDIGEVQDCRYQPSRYATPAIYAISDYYYSAPAGTQKPPKLWRWAVVGEYYGRKVYRAHMNDTVEK